LSNCLNPRERSVANARSAAPLLALMLIACGGCSGASDDAWAKRRPPVYPVSGRVLLGGQPLAGATVELFSADANRTAYGTADDEGRFQLTTFESGDGAVEGKHAVKVRKVDIISHDDPSIDYASSLQTAPPPETKWHSPRKYAEYATSGLSAVVVPDGPNEILLELEAK
jgi:hypothetical protein